jgi:hypothetical protein
MVSQDDSSRSKSSSNLGPGIFKLGLAQAGSLKTMREPPADSNRVFNNADSFAQAFDDAWKQHEQRDPHHGLDPAAKVELMLERLVDHPFLQSDPDLARQVAGFRLRLLGLAGLNQ